MLNINENLVNQLKNDSTLASLMNTTVPNLSIFSGAVDVVKQLQKELGFPLIEMHTISESVRTVPLNVKDTMVQLDIWSRVSELQVQQIYERVMILLNFQSTITTGSINGTTIEWQRSNGAVEDYSSEIRLWKISMDLKTWSYN
jgi:hypothetical protein